MKQPASWNALLRSVLFAITVLAVPEVRADVSFTVNTLADLIDDDTSDGVCHTSANSCSLRAAVMQSNHLTGPIATHINVPAGLYVLTRPASGANGEDSGDLNFTAPLSAGQTVFIDGSSAANTIIDANQIDRVVSIDTTARSVVISRVTIRNGFALAQGGGGIDNAGTLRVVDSIIEGNTSSSNGGGIISSGSLDILRSTLRNNTGDRGGAVAVFTATIRESSLYGNLARESGGGAFVYGFPPINRLLVVNSTISGNAANTDGGGIKSDASTYIYSSSIVNNDADHDRDELGGIGGGVWANPGSRFVAVNSLIANNTVLDAPIPDDCNGTLEVYGWNLLSTLERCAFSGNGSAARGIVSTSTISPLQDNGGPTWTHALLAGSQAIDSTNSQGCIDDGGNPLSVDQRGGMRVAGVRCDVGAFEYGSFADTIFRNGFDGGM